MNLENTKKSQSNQLTLGKLHFFVILVSILMEMLDRGSPYRFFSYLNLVIVLIVFFRDFNKFNSFYNKEVFYGLFIPISFVVLHFLAVSNLNYTKEFQRIVLVTFLFFGIWIQSKINSEYVKNNIFNLFLILILFYVVAQIVALHLFKRPYGTTANPHFLALYSAASLLFTSYSFFNMSKPWRWFLLVPLVFLGYFVLLSSSRPTWIGLILTSLLIIIFVESKLRKYSAMAVFLVLSALILTNINGFSDRFGELLTHLTTEERVTIWSDAWHMQKNSSISQWILGHGLNVYEGEFMQYSRYHLQGEDFKSPHNFILELVYTSGLIGVFLAGMLIFSIYRQIFQLMKIQREFYSVALLMLALLTTNLITTSITMSFFSGFNLNMIVVIVGMLIFIKENKATRM